MNVALSRHRGRCFRSSGKPSLSPPWDYCSLGFILVVSGSKKTPWGFEEKRVPVSLRKSPFSYWQYVLRTDRCLRLVVWGQRQPFPAPFSGPVFQAFLLKGEHHKYCGWQMGRIVFPCRNPREGKQKQKQGHTAHWHKNSRCAPLHELWHCLPSFLRRAWPRQAGRSSRVNGRALNFSSSNPDLEELRSCVTDPCFLWPVQSSLGLALQQSHAFSAV